MNYQQAIQSCSPTKQKQEEISSPITISLQSEFEQLTLDTSPKLDPLTNQHSGILDFIDEIDQEEKFKKHQSLSLQKDLIRRNNKNKTNEGQSSPNSNQSLNDQKFKYIKELWLQESPIQEMNKQVLSQRVISINEEQYFKDLQSDNVIGMGVYHSNEASPLMYFEPDIEADIYISSLIDSLWGNQIISRKLQKLIESGTPEQQLLIVQKLERISPQIEKDVFGNYVVQKIFDSSGDVKLKSRMFNKLKTHFYDLSKNPFGCRVMQKLIEYSQGKEEVQNSILSQLVQNMRSLIYDSNGNYVIFKMLESYDKSKMEFLIPIVEESFHYMAQQIYGCKIIHKIIQQYAPNYIANLVKQSIANYSVLSQTEFGNYILQHILQFWIVSPEKTRLIQLVIQQFYQLSINKYARQGLISISISNTVERALETLSKPELITVLNWLLFRNQAQQQFSYVASNFVQLANHQFANYVIKKFLILIDQQMQQSILNFLIKNQQEYQALKSTLHGNVFA
ncbi:unnamed protein product (macronuclear) [Paramecium tetraurelia]|uniref:PUM-HD domain-containing protein n=1 Tax=Paramecium tetraurelia TaxID=5888 RepID=A0E2S3_PARTE|nr:uncharacterized protein GSPATT00022762001 [Paramecium tetraurelia]CAK89590.1 unnamed protein product [Paramecium tetraurelia]|eukprot:XP_001456987.1 hypothetical protein (macronuclear) [Paramecium tetraurelia strain d4-2]